MPVINLYTNRQGGIGARAITNARLICIAIVFFAHFIIYRAMTSDGVTLAFVKMNGLGNQILVIDLRGQSVALTPTQVRAIAEHPQTAFDQLMVLRESGQTNIDAKVEIYNADGSEAGACGNGMRCVAWLEAEATQRTTLTFTTPQGVQVAHVASPEKVTVDMGQPKFNWHEIPLRDEFHDTRQIELQIGPIDDPVLHSPSVVSMGNPHAIFWVDDIAAYDLERFGPMLEHHPLFPERANISLANVRSESEIVVRTWERGAGLTQACGSAACACLVAAARKGLTGRKATVHLPGGALDITWGDDNHVAMTGPTELEHRGRLEI